MTISGKKLYLCSPNCKRSNPTVKKKQSKTKKKQFKGKEERFNNIQIQNKYESNNH